MKPTRAAFLVAAALLLSACGTYHLETAPPSEPTPTPTQRSTATPDADPVSEATSPVRVSAPLLVVNEDGSATVAARIENPNDSPLNLLGVGVSSTDENLTVMTTDMLMPLPAHVQMRVGDATDAGGFVVPQGVVAGGSYSLVFSVDNGTCVVAQAEAIERTGKHRGIYPTSTEFDGVTVPSGAAGQQCAADGS